MFHDLKRFFSVLGILVVLPSTSLAQEYTVPVDGTFAEGQILMSGGIPPAFDFTWTLQRQGNNVAMCGAGFVRDGRLNQTVNTMLRGAELELGAQRYPVDARFFTRVNRLSEVPCATATCRVLPIAVPSAPVDITLFFGDAVWRN